jgi:hypothetical protein
LKNIDPGQVAVVLARDQDWLRPDRIPAMMQVLMAEPAPARVALARHLAGVTGKSASQALARIAVFDPDPEVRREAVTALDGRPAGEYRDALLRGLSSPWEPPAEHAAEALAALRRVEAVPALLAALRRPDPRAPYSKGAGQYVRELVRVNHKRNCLMCHPASFNAADLPRREVPPLKEPKVAAGFGGYGGGVAPRKKVATPRKSATVFVRADVTYLKQAYSVTLGGERYDLLVRERPATAADVAAALARGKLGRPGQQEAAAFALRELTGEEGGPHAVNWVRFAERHGLAAKGR